MSHRSVVRRPGPSEALRGPRGLRVHSVRRPGRGLWMLGAMLSVLLSLPEPAWSFRLRAEQGVWMRWDASPRTVDGEERSLDGGLRYSIGGGSYEVLRDRLAWVPAPPSVEDFRAAVRNAFAHWTIEDPETGLAAGFHFVEDQTTEAVDDPGDPSSPSGFFGLNRGAEIDIFAEIPHAGPQYGASVVLMLDPDGRELTLTSGTSSYPGLAIAGADIRISPHFAWTLAGFELLLTHEIGHALGLGDVDTPLSMHERGSDFLDDDYDPSTSERARATLTNSFALRIDPLDPDASPLVAFAGDMKTDPGLDTPGVELLMETEGIFDLLDIHRAGGPVLQNDDFAARQFLYPVVLSPPGQPLGALLFISVGLAGLGLGMALGLLRKKLRESRR